MHDVLVRSSIMDPACTWEGRGHILDGIVSRAYHHHAQQQLPRQQHASTPRGGGGGGGGGGGSGGYGEHLDTGHRRDCSGSLRSVTRSSSSTFILLQL
jgi:hypothetical protein